MARIHCWPAGPSALLLLLRSIHGTGRECDRNQCECQGHSHCAGGKHRLKGVEAAKHEKTTLRATAAGTTGKLDLVASINRQKVKKLGVEPMVDGFIDLILAAAAREGTMKGRHRGLGKLEEPSLVDDDIGQGVAFAAEDVVGVASHGGDALVVGELDNLGLLDFDSQQSVVSAFLINFVCLLCSGCMTTDTLCHMVVASSMCCDRKDLNTECKKTDELFFCNPLTPTPVTNARKMSL